MSLQWFVVYCKSREELRAQRNLENQGVYSFFPKICKEKILRSKKKVVEEPLFPSYLFVNISKNDEKFSAIRSTRGINNFVKFGLSIATIPDQQIKKIEQLCHVNNKLAVNSEDVYQNGDKIEILSGPFKGLTAIFNIEDGLERSMLLLKILNQDNNISFKNSALKKVES
ncbi:NusG antitermination factor [Psychromonas ingrahamii 37]|uniref:Transcription antitermination protein RfaH n=1 Tax=Psychromonas ingrahamii (strain DSM 17664 / CCUG 51855 / 37) TaxID=357804 RepID=A1T084_PSYIN|nr:transcription/translation regulatory transformer protein RfaH [Psychromonas ingrahamii]ABM05149.1 NusG antitermination factor [Psychromonas ingrahamii 37]